MEPRVLPKAPPYNAELQQAFDRVMRGAPLLSLFKMVANNERVAQRMMAGGLLDRGSISPRQRELMILRTTARCGAEYEWGVHVAAFGGVSGWTPDELRATVRGDGADPVWTRDEALIVRLADSLHASNDIGDDLWRQLRDQFDEAQLVELIMLAGLYHAVSYLCRGLRVPLERGAPRFPQ